MSVRVIPSRAIWVRWLVAGLLLLSMFVALALVVSANSAAMDAWEQPLSAWIFNLTQGSSALLRTSEILQTLGSFTVQVALASVCVVVLVVVGRWRWAVFLMLSAIGSAAISEVTKHLVQRDRPVWAQPFFSETGFAFPSGHAASGISLWVAFGVVLLFVLPRPTATVVGWGVIVAGILMGISRVFYGVHWPSDVIGGWMLGSACLCLSAGICLYYWGRPIVAESEVGT